MISDYFDFLKRVAKNNPGVVKFRPIKEFIGVNKGFIRFALELMDGTELHIFEYVDSGLHKIDYLLSKLKLFRIIYIMEKTLCHQKNPHL